MTKPSIFYIIDDDRDDQDYLIAPHKKLIPIATASQLSMARKVL
jgi:hypothetical protein